MKTACALGLGILFVLQVAHAQQPPAPKLTTLVRSPVTGQPDKEFLLVSIEWPAGTGTPVHTHLGDEHGTVLEGSYTVKQGDGEWKTMNVGESWSVPASVVHQGKNAAQSTTKMINAFIVEKGKPLIHPVQGQ
ncbi:cupin domain-containing protein [Microvirga sp. BT688]|uniref:cupin domain-containing protein n=1 Tax=Microvirga sp. TaxID=1873136 RepID=UPI00168746F3|nr:cupin domain-containing protein [Microvirga sp.]MBD2749467.1 cupin domain-containing protein [Microvirga sp.]